MSDQAERADLDDLIRLGRKYKWATGETRSLLERGGINLVRDDFYSESPSLDDIERSFEYASLAPDGKPDAVFDAPDVFQDDVLVANAKSLIEPARHFDAPEEAETGFFWRNSQFSSIDALAYYGLIKRQSPRTVLEIGSGFSTHVAHRALTEIGAGRLMCIDPEPRTDIAGLSGIRFRKQPIQAVTPEALAAEVGPGDIVFYDGSHTLKTGSDTVYFYLKVLPALPRGVLVHAHDVHLPYPRNKKAMTEAKIYWGEQYILMAHLHNTARYRVLFATHYLQRRHPALMRDLIRERYPIYGGSLWFEVV